jgi:hypothetical protein
MGLDGVNNCYTGSVPIVRVARPQRISDLLTPIAEKLDQ